MLELKPEEIAANEFYTRQLEYRRELLKKANTKYYRDDLKEWICNKGTICAVYAIGYRDALDLQINKTS